MSKFPSACEPALLQHDVAKGASVPLVTSISAGLWWFLGKSICCPGILSCFLARSLVASFCQNPLQHISGLQPQRMHFSIQSMHSGIPSTCKSLWWAFDALNASQTVQQWVENTWNQSRTDVTIQHTSQYYRSQPTSPTYCQEPITESDIKDQQHPQIKTCDAFTVKTINIANTLVTSLRIQCRQKGWTSLARPFIRNTLASLEQSGRTTVGLRYRDNTNWPRQVWNGQDTRVWGKFSGSLAKSMSLRYVDQR
jgi:hypothetical protein